MGGWTLDSTEEFYFLCLLVTVGATLAIVNLLRSSTGVPLWPSVTPKFRRKAWASTWRVTRPCLSPCRPRLAGIGGALYAHKIQFLSPEQFSIIQSIDLLLMVVIGGLGSIHGAFLGAIFLIVMPQLISLGKDFLPAAIGGAAGLQGTVYGMVLIAFVLFEPMGLYGRWLKVRTWFQLFPFYRRGLFKRQKSFQKSDRLK